MKGICIMQKCNLKNKIWLVLDSRSFGGIESHVFYLASALKENFCNICVVFLNDYGTHSLEVKLNNKNISYMKCSGTLDFIRLIKKEKPRLIHSHGYKANLISRFAGVLYHIPTVSSFHAGDCETLRLKLYTSLDRYTAFLSHPVAVNKAIAGKVKGAPQVIDNFVPLPMHKKNIERIQHIGFVGRLSYEKGPDRFLDLAARFPTLKFHIFGDGPKSSSLRSKTLQNVKFHGHVVSIESIWSTIDILCMPSRKEGLPMAALESMAYGVPVIAYNAGALSKLITHNMNGWILPLPKEDSVLTSDIESVLRGLTIMQTQMCSLHARKTISDFYSPKVLIHKFIELYDDVIEQNLIKMGAVNYVAS